jgi:hypothetical protein
LVRSTILLIYLYKYNFNTYAGSLKSAPSYRALILYSLSKESLKVSISFGSPKPFKTKLVPAEASLLAIPRPIPLVDPVIRATLPGS